MSDMKGKPVFHLYFKAVTVEYKIRNNAEAHWVYSIIQAASGRVPPRYFDYSSDTGTVHTADVGAWKAACKLWGGADSHRADLTNRSPWYHDLSSLPSADSVCQ